MSKIIINYEDAKPKITKAIHTLADPVIQTLSPRGGNVIFEDAHGNTTITNDGVTIAKQIESEDPVEDKVIDLIRFASLRTNSEAGDGTTTATLLTKTLAMECMRLLDNGMSRLELKNKLRDMSERMVEELKKHKITIESDEDLLNIARISSNNDDDIAQNILEVIKAAGQDGLVVLDAHHKTETQVIVEPGFLLNQPLAFPELVQNKGSSAVMDDVAVLVTDKRLYYEEEAETILRSAIEQGHKQIVVVAADFIGKTPNYFLANHLQGGVKLILIKESDASVLEDLATYLGGQVISEKSGSLVGNLTPDQFIIAEKVFSDNRRSILSSKKPDNEETKLRIDSLRKQIDDTEDSDDLEKRLASLTNGTVTVRVGGNNPVEVQERIFRYDDAINATRAAQKDGYVVGGGLTLLNLSESIFEPQDAFYSTVKKYCQASVLQIAENSGEHPPSILKVCSGDNPHWGYNAKTGEFGNLKVEGVIDPYKVTEMVIQNSISVVSALLTSGYFIVNDNKQEDE